MKTDLALEDALKRAKPSLQRKMQHSVELLQKAQKIAMMYDSENGFWLGFSGGKDSQAMIHIAQLAGVPFKAFFSPTSVDPPEIIRFIRRQYPEVEFTQLKTSIYKHFIKAKCLPSMKIRWCCAEFKEKGGENKVVLVGVRHAEGSRRAKRHEVEVSNHKFSGDLNGFGEWSDKQRKKLAKRAEKQKDTQFDQFSEHKEQMVTCINGKDKIIISPIIDWSEQDVWEFLNDVMRVPHCELYDKGRRRLGCICCPMASIKNTLRDIREYPYVKEKWIKAIMEVRKEGMSAQNTPPNLSDLQVVNTPPHKPNIYQLPQRGKPLPIAKKNGQRAMQADTSVRQSVQNWGGRNQSPRRNIGIWSGVFR
jgi:phosphoadenosine phosphosulfate reductase